MAGNFAQSSSLSLDSPAHGPTGGLSAWLAVLVLLMAALLRGLYLAVPELNGDMAVWGVQAIDILAGRPHWFFAGELFGGSLEAWLAAPLFAMFGPSALLLSLVPYCFSLLMVWQTWRLASREMGPWPGLAAMAWAALSPWFLTQHSVWPLGAYIETPCLALFCFGLTLRLGRLDSQQRGARLWPTSLTLGLLWGLGLWTHLLMLPAIAACGLFLLARRPRLLVSSQLFWLALGFIAGGLPLWVISLPAGLLRPEVLGEGRALQLLPAWNAFWATGLPILLGLLEPVKMAWLWEPGRWVVWTLYGLVFLGLLRPGVRRGVRSLPGGELTLLALAYLAIYLLVWLFSGAYSQNTWRHLTPMYAGLPLAVGAGLAALGRRGKWLAVCLGLLLLGGNLWGSLTLAPYLREHDREAYQSRRESEQKLFARLENEGQRHVYAQWFWDAIPLTFQAAARLTFSDQLSNHFPRLTTLADASAKPGYLITTRETDFRNTLAAAGISSRNKDRGHLHIYGEFKRSLPSLRALAPHDWTSPQPGGEMAWDRRLSTSWTMAQPQRPGQRFLLDLGRAEPGLCLVEVMPGPFMDAAQGLELRTSLDGEKWETASSTQGTAFGPLFWCLDRPLLRFLPARQQLAFAPRPARYLEIVQTGQAGGRWWSLAEIMIYQEAGPPIADPSPERLSQALAEMPQEGPVFAPPQALARLSARRRGYLDPQLPAAAAFPLDKLTIPLRQDVLVCLPRHEWEAARPLWEPRLAGPATLHEVGGWVVVGGLQAMQPKLRRLPWPEGSQARASLLDGMASQPLKPVSGLRWHTGEPQRPGQWHQVTWEQPVNVAGALLDAGAWPEDEPRGLEVEVSEDGKHWSPTPFRMISRAPLIWGGDKLLLGNGPLALAFSPQEIRGLRLIQTGSHPQQHWSIARLELLGAGGAPGQLP